jgi:choline dehydrogenase-like flavoprotein
LSPVREKDFNAIQSFALGGLANVWGAGLYRFTNEDLEDFPLTAAELDPYFDKLTAHIGITGQEDDLTPYFGSTASLLPPLRLSHNIRTIFKRYTHAKRDPSLAIGRARIGVLTEPRAGRPAYSYEADDFFRENRAIYSPRYTLESLLAEGRIELRGGVLVRSWSEDPGGVKIQGVDIERQESVEFEARKVIVACGAIQSAKIALRSAADYRTRLSLLENPAVQVPLVLPASIGRALERDAFGLVQLNLIWHSSTFKALLQGSLMEITAPARAEFFSSLPFSARANLELIRYMLPGMIVMQLFFPAACQSPSSLHLLESGELQIEGHPNTLDLTKLKPLLRALRRLGAWTSAPLIVRVPTGHAIHYAGTLPMKRSPSAHECFPTGQLYHTRNVFVADSATFADLPAKNMSFAMMANAMRIAGNVAQDLRSQP